MSKKEDKPKAVEKTAEKKKPSRVARMFELVLAGHTNASAVVVIKKEFGAKVPTTTASIGWCRSQLRRKTKYAKIHNPENLKILSDKEAAAKETK
jgi:hypothetical protein